MPIVSLKTHYERKTIHHDVPFDLSEGAQLIVTVLEPIPSDPERAAWFGLSARGLGQAYGDSEPEYSSTDLLP